MALPLWKTCVCEREILGKDGCIGVLQTASLISSSQDGVSEWLGN
jgi:hypothetical protein